MARRSSPERAVHTAERDLDRAERRRNRHGSSLPKYGKAMLTYAVFPLGVKAGQELDRARNHRLKGKDLKADVREARRGLKRAEGDVRSAERQTRPGVSERLTRAIGKAMGRGAAVETSQASSTVLDSPIRVPGAELSAEEPQEAVSRHIIAQPGGGFTSVEIPRAPQEGGEQEPPAAA